MLPNTTIEKKSLYVAFNRVPWGNQFQLGLVGRSFDKKKLTSSRALGVHKISEMNSLFL